MFHGERHIRIHCYGTKDTEYKESSVTTEVPSYFNIFECGRNILDRLDVSYERACMAIQSTISDSTYFVSEELVDAVSKGKAYMDYI